MNGHIKKQSDDEESWRPMQFRQVVDGIIVEGPKEVIDYIEGAAVDVRMPGEPIQSGTANETGRVTFDD